MENKNFRISSSTNLICSGESAFLLHCCTDVFLSTALLYRCTSKPAVPSHIQRSTNGNNEPFQWNYQRSIINYCLARRGGSMEHAGCYNVLAANHQLLKTCWLLSYKLLTIQLLATFEDNTSIIFESITSACL